MHNKYGLNELREMFLKFFETKDHLRLPSFSLIPQNDASVLLINAGMTPMKPYFRGEEEPPRHRICTCQKCIRTGDIDNVGKTARHGTYFEMLGNFSFGDYFKHEAIAWSWEFLTSPEWVGLEPDRLYPSVFVDDDEAFDIWNKEIGIPKERIFRFGKEDNFWEHGAGPCGPCSEIYYDRGEEYGCGKPDCTVGCDCDRYIEVWNNVFSQFDNDGHNNYTELKQKNIDTGMGLERLACVSQCVDSLFDVDTVMNITNKVSELTGAYYGRDHKTDVSLRVITDHIRSSVFMISDGITPTNEGRGYILRRLMRRAARHGKLLNVSEPFLWKVVDTVVHENECQYPELREKEEYIISVIKNEEENFNRTLDSGMNKFRDILEEHKAKGETVFSGADAFRLYDTFGFPLDLTIEMCADESMTVDEEGFAGLMQEQREKAREARKALGDLGWAGIEFGKDVPETEFIGYGKDKGTGVVTAIVYSDKLHNELRDGEEGIIVLDRSVFYAEMGGQTGDRGTMHCGDAIFVVSDVQKNKGGKFMHYGKLSGGNIKVGDTVECEVSATRRNAVSRAHSATHMLQAALRAVLGEHVHQKGSFVDEDYLRFDFSNMSALSSEEIRKTEELVNGYILSGKDIETEVMSLDEARKSGATALFGEKYSSMVRVVKMGDFSSELCGGTHLSNTALAGSFHIISESSVASGVRRIEAVTGMRTVEMLAEEERALIEAAAMFKAKPEELSSRIESQFAEIRELKKTIEQFKAKESSGNASEYLKNARSLNGVSAVAVKLSDKDANTLRNIGDVLREKDKSVVALLASVNGEKISYLCVCGPEAVEKGYKAGEIIRTVSAVSGGKGGGKADSAMGGGSDLSKLDASLDEFYKFIEE